MLDGSPIEKQLRVGEAHLPELRGYGGATPAAASGLAGGTAGGTRHLTPPLWMASWLSATNDSLGAALAKLTNAIADGQCARDDAAASQIVERSAPARSSGISLSSSLGDLPRLPPLGRLRPGGHGPLPGAFSPRVLAAPAAATFTASSSALPAAVPAAASAATLAASEAAATAAVSSAAASDGLLSRTILLRSVPLLRNLLTLHAASLATHTFERLVASGEHFCQPGEAYILLEGTAHKAGRPPRVGGRVYSPGAVVQQLGCIYDQLPPLDFVAGSDEDGEGADGEGASSGDGGSEAAGTSLRLLVIPYAAVWEILTHSPPRFGLSLLKGLVQLGAVHAGAPPGASNHGSVGVSPGASTRGSEGGNGLGLLLKEAAPSAAALGLATTQSPSEGRMLEQTFGLGSNGSSVGLSRLGRAARHSEDDDVQETSVEATNELRAVETNALDSVEASAAADDAEDDSSNSARGDNDDIGSQDGDSKAGDDLLTLSRHGAPRANLGSLPSPRSIARRGCASH